MIGNRNYHRAEIAIELEYYLFAAIFEPGFNGSDCFN